jgi:16S rRNA U516 pseudouridylate synthase RsuA-like enzyme
MKITVIRSGGFAGLRRTWTMRVEDQQDRESWRKLVDGLPWNDRRPAPPQPDRYVYLIRVSRRRITLQEQQVDGPWRELVERVKAAAG